jgi:hypothetical protein
VRVTVITPVGPGHQRVSEECAASVREAWEHSRGPFDAITHQLWDDTEGKLGRSRARNLAMDAADWFFFLDADDLCDPLAFVRFDEARESDPVAVFGAVCTDRFGVTNENVYPLDWDTLIRHGPRGTLSMGCFVRGDVARQTRFNEELDAGEDFDFYLRALRGRRWVKVEGALALIRLSVPSATGPRGYTSLDWQAACMAVIRTASI